MDRDSSVFSLPPTRNDLDYQQRSRLIRSTRKLGALLGTTPQLVEIDPSVQPISLSLSQPRTKSKYSRGDGSIMHPPTSPESLYTSSASTNSSVTSLALSETPSTMDLLPNPKSFSKGRRSADVPRPLVLRLNPVVVPTTDPRVVPTSPTTARASAFRRSSISNIPTPTTPVFRTEAEIRRKKMAKLTRTLGENIPAELVFASRPSRGNTTVMREAPPPPSRSSRIWETGAAAWRGEWNRKDIRDVQSQLRNLRAR